MGDKEYTEATDTAFVNASSDVWFRVGGGRVEWDSIVGDDELDALFIGISLDKDASCLVFRISIVHHVDHSFFQSKV